MPPALLTLVLLAATLTWAFLHGPAERRTPAGNSLLVALGCGTVGAAFQGYGADVIDPTTGWPNTARLIRWQLAVAALAALETMLAYWQLPPKYARPHAAWRICIAAGVVITMAGLFLLAAPDPSDRSAPTIAYKALFAVTLAAAMVDLAVHSRRHAKHLDAYPYTLVGLHLFTVAGWTGCFYPAISLTNILGTATGLFGLPGPLLQIGSLVGNTSTALIAAGAVVPTIGPGVARCWRRVRRARAAAHLRPLWQAIIDGHPGLQLDRRPHPREGLADLLTTMSSGDDWRIYRRVIEVRDGYLELRPWMDEEVVHLAAREGRNAGLRGRQLEAAVEAAVIAAALRAKHRQQPPTGTGQHVDPGEADMSGEIRWLAHVSRQLTHPVVARVLAELDRRDQAKRTWVHETFATLGIRR